MGRMTSTKEDNFTKRLKQCWGSELDPEFVSPETAGAEELPQYVETMPIEKQFKRGTGTGTYSRNTGFKNEGGEE